MSKVLFYGLTTVDIFNYVDAFPGPNEKKMANEQQVLAGGPAANAAVACSSIAANATLISSVGKHPLGELIKRDLKSNKVELLDCAEDEGAMPVISSITIDGTSGERSVVYSSTKGRSLKISFDMADYLEQYAVLMLDGHFLDNGVALAEAASRNGVIVVLDGGSWKKGLEDLLPFIDYAICSEDFMPPGCVSTDEVIDFMHRMAIAYVAVSRGAEPLIYSTPSIRGEIQIPTQEVVDTLGAGDILHGVFCAEIIEKDFVTSLESAASYASSSCLFPGTRAWLTEV